MSVEQWNAFADYFPENNINYKEKTGNYRPTQPLNERKVFKMFGGVKSIHGVSINDS